MRLQSLRHSLPDTLYSAAQVRQLDALAIAQTMGGGYGLMRRAGKAAFRVLNSQFEDLGAITIFCGGGNNGGDGYVVAELALAAGFDVTLFYLIAPDRLRGEARQAADNAIQAGVECRLWDAGCNIEGDLIVDALLGTGLSGPVREGYALAVTAINKAAVPVLAIDIPSGLHADTGMPLGPVVKADCTVSFIGLKQGLLTGKAADYVGRLWFDDLSVPEEIYRQVPSCVRRANFSALRVDLPLRERSSHKGNYGHVLVVGGEEGFGGAAIMAAEAACHVGAGLVSCATHASHIQPGLARLPEIMYRAAPQRSILLEMLERADVVAIGPGLGRQPWAKMCLQTSVAAGKPLVLDADGLNLLTMLDTALPKGSVITPHPGEAARLLGISNAEINADRYASIGALAEKYSCTVVLKGAGSLIAGAAGNRNFGGKQDSSAEQDSNNLIIQVVAEHGNPGMAKGGMGDVLTGMIAGLLGQGLAPQFAAALAVCWHAAAADQLARRHSEYSYTASQVSEILGELLGAAL